ncbi:MAG: CoA-binding protein [Planctomycetota bacterium]
MSERLPPYRSFLASDAEIREILRDHRCLAMVGLSRDPEGAHAREAQALRLRGYRILPVHPDGGELRGTKIHTDLRSIGEEVEIVVLLAGAGPADSLLEEAHEIGASVFWMEAGDEDARTAYRATRLGMQAVINRTVFGEYEMHFPDDEVGYPG